MKVAVIDLEALNAITPANVLGYLRGHGWARYGKPNERFSVWHHPTSKEAEILVSSGKSADFATRMLSVLTELENFEQRGQLEILTDLYNSGFDIVRIAVKAEASAQGTLRVESGVKLVKEARDLLLAAACSAVHPRAVFRSRKPRQAVEYLGEARIGQTERGSFVLTMLSPVAPHLTMSLDGALFPQPPYERQVVQTLAEGVATTIEAARHAIFEQDEGIERFRRGVPKGVSANLCDALVGLQSTAESATVGLSVSWAANRPAPERDVPLYSLVDSDVVSTIAEAARVFRETDVIENFCVAGPIVKLERQDGETIGQVTILGQVDDAVRRVSVRLEAEDYILANLAHREYQAVRVYGRVVRDGRSFRILNPSGFTIDAEGEDLFEFDRDA